MLLCIAAVRAAARTAALGAIVILLAGCVASASPSALPSSAPSPSVAAPPPAASGSPSASPAETTLSSSTTCPATTGHLGLEAYLAADQACFGTGDVSLVAWLDYGLIGGLEGPAVVPVWLANELPLVLLRPSVPTWEVRPSGEGLPLCLSNCDPFLAFSVNPASRIVVEPLARWVLATGHRGDALAETCSWDLLGYHVEPGSLTLEMARARCRVAFVLTRLESLIP